MPGGPRLIAPPDGEARCDLIQRNVRSGWGAYLTPTFAVMETPMPAYTKIEPLPEKSQTREPAKGGLEPAHDSAHPSGDSPKPHGDPMRHVIVEENKK